MDKNYGFFLLKADFERVSFFPSDFSLVNTEVIIFFLHFQMPFVPHLEYELRRIFGKVQAMSSPELMKKLSCLVVLETMLFFGHFLEQNLADIGSEVRIDICEHAG